MPAGGGVSGGPNSTIPRRAMVLAAGLGLRMRPITERLPKPLIAVAGRTLLDHAIDRLEEAGVKEIIINVHHLREMIERHLQSRHVPRIRLSKEETLLETGGGVAQALTLLGTRPFFVVNSDVIWLDGRRRTLESLAALWNEARMDGLLLVHPIEVASGYHGCGDFFMDANNRLIRREAQDYAPYIFAGVQILHPRLFDDAPEGAFSLNRLYDQAIGCGRLFGHVHEGKWFHVGTLDDFAIAEAHMRREQKSLSA